MEQDESLSASPKPMRKAISIKLKSNKSPSTSRRKTRSTRSSKKEENEPVQAAGNEIRDFPTILKSGPGDVEFWKKHLIQQNWEKLILDRHFK